MSQQQPNRPQAMDTDLDQATAIRYGDVFTVQGDLAGKPVAPGDAAALQAAEARVLGRTPRSGPGAVMGSAATVNYHAGAVDRNQTTDSVRDQGVSVSVADVAGVSVVTETVAGQVVGQYVDPTGGAEDVGRGGEDGITVGEALEAAALSVGEKPVDQADAAAIQAAEVRAIQSNRIPPGGIAAMAQSAANQNARTMGDENKTTVGDILSDAATKLSGDKEVTREDAQGVIEAEIRNKPDLRTTPGGVAAAMAAAARVNRDGI
ncbi:Late embryogenesis abundant protein 31 [Linum grandiflorum]